MGKKVSKNKREVTQRIKYIQKVTQEFLDNNWDTSKLFKGNRTVEGTSKNKKSFEGFKKHVAELRKINKERKKIHEEYLIIEEKQKEIKKVKQAKKQKAFERIQQINLNKHYKNSTTKNNIWIKRDELGLKDNTMENFSDIQKAIVEYTKNGLFKEITMPNPNGTTSTYGGFFKNQSETTFLHKEYLDELFELIEKDKNAMRNISLLFDYIYDVIIPLKYESDQAEYNRKDKKADTKFWHDVASKMLDYYKEINY